MIKKTITYTTFDGEEVTEDCYFHFSKQEAIAMIATGMDKKFEEIGNSGDPKLIIDTFHELVLDAYGRKTPDGRGFVKNAEIREEFKNSIAFDEFLMTLVTDDVAAAEFVNKVIPNVDVKN